MLSTKEFVTSYISLFKEAKIELDVIDLVQNCLIKMMKRLKSLQNKTYAVFILDKNMLMQCLFSNDNFVMTRRSRILADRRTKGSNGKWGRTSTASSSSTSQEQTGAEITDIFLCRIPRRFGADVSAFASNFGVTVRAFPEYQPGELGLSEGMNPGDFIVLLGSLIRYSD